MSCVINVHPVIQKISSSENSALNTQSFSPWMTSDQKNNKLLYILKICFHSYMPVLPYLSFLSFPSRLFFIQPPTTLLWILPESVLSATQLRRDPVVKITDVFPSFLSFRWDGLTTPCCPFLPPPSASSHLSQSPSSHTLTPHLSCSYPCTPHM